VVRVLCLWHVWLVGATGWMFVSLHRFGGLPAWMAVVAVGCLCALPCRCFTGHGGWAWVRWRRVNWLADAGAVRRPCGCWPNGAGFIFTGFPWGASGYALLDTPWQVLAPWVGVYGMGWAVFTRCAPGWCWSMAASACHAHQCRSRVAGVAPVVGLGGHADAGRHVGW
jgi:apolipoprotein N-acyltransferase